MGRLKQWEELTIQDNFLFQKVMQNRRICKHLIEKILGIRIEKITFPESEKSVENRYDSKSIRLDVYVHDENGRVYDIEMQCTNGSEGELPKRTRYYQGMIDMDELKKGQYYRSGYCRFPSLCGWESSRRCIYRSNQPRSGTD